MKNIKILRLLPLYILFGCYQYFNHTNNNIMVSEVTWPAAQNKNISSREID